jgi:hypothetical protein
MIETDDDYSDADWITFICESCGVKTTTLKTTHDGFNVCLECRWFDERPWIKRREQK